MTVGELKQWLNQFSEEASVLTQGAFLSVVDLEARQHLGHVELKNPIRITTLLQPETTAAAPVVFHVRG